MQNNRAESNNNREDTEKITKYWRDTHECRINILLIQKTSVDDFISLFKALREQIGINLVQTLFYDILILQKNLF